MNEALGREIQNILGLISAHRMPAALSRAQQLIADFADEPEAWRFYAHLAASNGAFDKAILGYRRAVALNPTDIRLNLEMAQAATACNRRRLALEIAQALSGMLLEKAAEVDALGSIFTFCEEAALALPLFEAACAAEPNNPSFLSNLASAQRMNGKTKAAEATIEKLIGIAPNDVRAYLMRSDLRPQSVDNNNIAELEQAISERRGGPEGEPMLQYALAKELEDLGEHKRSFQHLSRASVLQNARERYRLDDDIAMMKRLIERHGAPEQMQISSGYQSNAPIFVIGLPRSGTTLIERILSSHPQVGTIGESHAFGVAVRQLLQMQLGRTPSKSEIVDLGLGLEPSVLGKSYLEETQPQSSKSPRFVDKMLINYLHAGLIRRALPNAVIIAVRRHPLDSCYSMYKSMLTGQFGFTSSMTQIARYYGAWARLMDHWRATLGPSYREVRYEELVSEPEANMRAMVEFADLPWDDRCLSFHQSEAAVSTASASQVRRPIYTSSIGKWRAYLSELRPLIEGLEAEGISVD